MFWRRVNKITATEAMALREKSDVTFIDVRLPRHFAQSHIEGARNIHRKTVAEEMRSADRAHPVICYCYSGFSSKTACVNLERAGFQKVYNLKGGYPAWKRASKRTS